MLYYLLAAHPGRTIVFVNAVSTARRVAALLKLLKMPSSALHAGAHAPPTSNSSGCQCLQGISVPTSSDVTERACTSSYPASAQPTQLANTESCSECLHVMDVDG